MINTKQRGMYEWFDRSGQHTRATHYCAGCGHGIIHKLVAEVVHELALEDRMIYLDPVGCAVFAFYYLDGGHLSAAHGRAAASATGIARARPNAIVLSYQGDGDLASIGFNHSFQAASRGEKIAVIFVNNATYGMTGGQMAPTTLPGQKTVTSPWGRDPATTGYPLHVCEVFDQLRAPVYIARVSVAESSRIMAAKRAIRKALEIQRDGKGYAFVEILSPCPTNFGVDPLQAADFCIQQMEAEFPLGTLRDHSEDTLPLTTPIPTQTVESFFSSNPSEDLPNAQDDEAFGEIRLKFAGFGGQGILSLGLCVAQAARLDRRHTIWFPSYGPEQRGGSASCSVVLSGKSIGSPCVDHPDVLVCMNQPSYESFAHDVPQGGTILVDATVPKSITTAPDGVRVIRVPAIALAKSHSMPKAANTIMLAALKKLNLTRLSHESIEQAIIESFSKKTDLAEKNHTLLLSAESTLAI